MARSLLVRHFRQTVFWPVQLMPLRRGEQVQRHWEALEELPDNPWHEVVDKFCADPAEFQERHYKEFVTFLPYVQRFLYGANVGQEASRRDGEPSMHVYRRADVKRVRIVYDERGTTHEFDVGHAELCFFLDADVAILSFELHTNDIPLDLAQETLFRFGRAYPAYWDFNGFGGNCPRSVEWLDATGRVLASSDYAAKTKYLSFVSRHRAPCIAHHWEHLLLPLGLEYPGQSAPLRYRQLEYSRMPFMAYIAVDDPTELSRADFVRFALVTRPGERDTLPYSDAALADFEKEYCDDRFWGRTGERFSGDTRFIVSGQTFVTVGRHDDVFFSGATTGLLGQFRHQYFLLFLIAHFHKAALLSIADELAVAMNRLTVGDTESVKTFKRTVRQMMEVFLRFTHRYWFHEVSNQNLARSVFGRLSKHLGTDELHDEVRHEVVDMSSYLDSDSARRQANTVLRLTVVTILGLIGTVASGLLGMNLLDETHRSVPVKVIVFVVVLLGTFFVTMVTVAKSKRLADILDTISDERLGWKGRWRAVWAAGPFRRRKKKPMRRNATN